MRDFLDGLSFPGSDRLHRSSSNKMLTGVCGGIAETYDLDPTVVRLVAALLMGSTNAVGVLLYALLVWYLPVE